MSNLGWMFYKNYFRGLDYTNISSEKNSNLIKERVKTLTMQTVKLEQNEMLGNIHFKATTTYPGLILGSGNAHELPAVEGQAILGFHFDYTSGLPTIQGSSIKGVLRSAFKHPEYIQELLEDESFDVKGLEAEIFDNGDIFFDATVVKTGTNLLGDDYLAPHGDALKNPIPLRFIKVMPNVTFVFDFELKSGLLDKEKKAILFANILSDLGIGAKTNVGYGKFNADLVSKAKSQIESAKEEKIKADEAEKLRLEEEEKVKALDQVDSTIEKIKIEIKEFGKQDTKVIFETMSKYELEKSEKDELIQYMNELIGPKPKPKNKAAIKWAIKIYEHLEQ